MAGFLVKLPRIAVQQLLELPPGPIVETAVKLGTFIAVLCFASFMYAMWLPKLRVAKRHDGGHRWQTPSAALQKKKSRAKRSKKARNAGLSKATVEVEVLSDGDEALEEELEFVANQAGTIQAAKLETSFDEEAPPMPRDTKDTSSYGKPDSSKEATAGKTDPVSNRHDKKLGLAPQPRNNHHEPAKSYASRPVDENMQQHNVADDQILKLAELKELRCGETDHQATMSCEMCTAPQMPTFGCADLRKYTTSLLLQHRKLHLLAARGPPGLPKPAEMISPVTAGLRCVCVSEV